ncbi:unnamed protein product [Didymodactylos carnosus]|uniref:PNPLA domain-containing protein n=1 Tax=Didymodactylos carnosus TaxID=1234261 RepID=A0A815VBG6_9BILA|nr:unnamed protein product [Didymodactylos carnosus]CAF4389088.1 unnamed protein product [Didymodactylos carnosus]
MQEILMCTTAAPTYFSPHSMVAEKSLYVERGVQANNPTMIAYVKAIQDYQLPRDKIVVLSVVTGDYVPDELGPNRKRNLLFWYDNSEEISKVIWMDQRIISIHKCVLYWTMTNIVGGKFG